VPFTSLPRTLVVGGGIGGLTVAAALSRLGVQVRVVEQAPSFDPIGAGIGIQANGNAVLQALGIELSGDDTTEIGTFEVIDQRGRILTRGNPDEILPDPPSVHVHRADLHRALLDACRKVPLETGRPARGVRSEGERVIVEFENGSEEEAELVIAADGANSPLRRSLRGKRNTELRYSGQTCWRFALEAPDLVPEVSVERWSPGRRAGVIPLSRGRIYVYLVESAPRGTPGPGTSSPDHVRAHFGGIDAELDAVLERLDDTVAINHDDLCDREGADFGEGRVVLIGDAAHPMTPNAGQGAGTAIEDAGVLALLLPQHMERLESLPGSLAARRSERVCSVQRLAWRIGQVAHWRNPIARFLRDSAIRAIPQSLVAGQARALWQPGIEIARELRASGRFD